MTDGPLIVQSDKTLLLEVDHADAEAARRAIAPFAELERAPEHVHTYRLTPLGLWNARAAGHDAEQVVNALITYSRYAVPHALLIDVADTMDRYGRLTLEKDRRPASCCIAPTAPCSRRSCGTSGSSRCSASASTTSPCWSTPPSAATSSSSCSRSAGRPRTSPATSTARRTRSRWTTSEWSLRPYQQQAVDGFWHGGSGVVVLPCGAGKTLVGAGAMAQGRGDDADPGHQHRLGAAVAGRAAAADHADRGRDRRVLGSSARRSARSRSRPTRC